MSGWDTPAADPWAADATGAESGGHGYENGGGADLGGAGGDEFSGGNNDRACFNCGQPGHQKSECTNEAVAREFTGECRGCGQVGHRKADCPDAPAIQCKNCKEEGHPVNDCKNPRKDPFATSKTMAPEAAWTLIKAAVDDRDAFDFKEACLCYLKAVPDLSFGDLSTALINLKIPGYLVALQNEVGELYTFMDAQGNLGKTYQVAFRFQPGPQRAAEADAFPKSSEENEERLKDAGISVDCLMEKCNNCNELGHSRKRCPQDKAESSRAKVTCVNCQKDGHRSRDCPDERKDPFACKNCNSSGHNAKECPEPRNPATVMCKECEEMGHFSRDCPTKPQIPCFNCGQTGHRKADCTNEAVLICRNCDAHGHIGKDCPEKKDWSRVKCRNCGENGHSQVRCPQPPKEEDNGDGDVGGYDGGMGNAAVDEYQGGEAATNLDGW